MSVYRVAVYEDDDEVRKLICGLCGKIYSGWGVDADIDAFDSAGDAVGEDYDLYLLDIQMPGESGIALARRLYGSGVRDRVIFITGSAEYALDGYSAHPVHYLLKPVEREALEGALRLAWELRRPRTLLFRAGAKTAAFPAEDVLYLESRSHGVVLHLAGEERFLATSLTEAQRAVPGDSFARSHKSYLVNLAKVAEVGRSELKLTDGGTVPVSRTFYSAFQGALVRYLNR